MSITHSTDSFHERSNVMSCKVGVLISLQASKVWGVVAHQFFYQTINTSGHKEVCVLAKWTLHKGTLDWTNGLNWTHLRDFWIHSDDNLFMITSWFTDNDNAFLICCTAIYTPYAIHHYTIPHSNLYKILLLMVLECSYTNSDRIPLEFWTCVHSRLSATPQ